MPWSPRSGRPRANGASAGAGPRSPAGRCSAAAARRGPRRPRGGAGRTRHPRRALVAPSSSGSSAVTSLGAGPPQGPPARADRGGRRARAPPPPRPRRPRGGRRPEGDEAGERHEGPRRGRRAPTDPAQGIPAYAVQPSKGTFRAFSSARTHAGRPTRSTRSTGLRLRRPRLGLQRHRRARDPGARDGPLPAIAVALGPGDSI